jgi:pimeloyl-ACP methyl ester carboxylesterase
VRIIAVFILAISAQCCVGQPGIRLASDGGQRVKLPKDTMLKIGGINIWIQNPPDSIPMRGTLLLLPGWDYSFTKWCDSTNVCITALRKGFAVVAPDMGRSIYASRYFPETRKDLMAYPTLTWLDSALEILRSGYPLFGAKNLVLGLSTGARGVALICEKRPDFFHAAAALSGDFNQYNMPNDRLMAAVYGKFGDRWKNEDNPVSAIDAFKTPIYIGHGAMDKVVPSGQSQEFYDSLVSRRSRAVKGKDFGGVKARVKSTQEGTGNKGANPNIKLHIDPRAGHNFAYWRSELPAVWEFFNRY